MSLVNNCNCRPLTAIQSDQPRTLGFSIAILLTLMSGCWLTDGNSRVEDVTGANDSVVLPDWFEMNGQWLRVKGPCPGSATNALWFDDRQSGWAGCGQNAEGKGLLRTSDGGLTWDSLPEFEQVRVNDIRRGPDGKLYGAGFHTIEGYSAFVIDESGEPKPIGLFDPGDNAFASVTQAENVAVTQDGQILVDSLTGVSAAYKPSTGDFAEFECLGEEALADSNASGFQVRRIATFENRFFATGSLINTPGTVYLPSKLEGATYHLQTIELQTENEDGELLDMYIWDNENMIVVGYDQSYSRPLVYSLQGDPYDREQWEEVSFANSGIEYQAGIEAISVVGDVVLAVGERVPTSSGGLAAISFDRGVNWVDITPSDESGRAGPLSKAWLFSNGDMVLAGGGYEMWVFSADR